jgi:hypothetical protein
MFIGMMTRSESEGILLSAMNRRLLPLDLPIKCNSLAKMKLVEDKGRKGVCIALFFSVYDDNREFRGGEDFALEYIKIGQ